MWTTREIPHYSQDVCLSRGIYHQQGSVRVRQEEQPGGCQSRSDGSLLMDWALRRRGGKCCIIKSWRCPFWAVYIHIHVFFLRKRASEQGMD